MSKFSESIKKHYKLFLLVGAIDIVVGLAIFFVFYFAINVRTIIGAIDGTGIAGAVILSLFIFSWLGRNGAFDTMSYGFSQMFASMFGKQANKYNDFVGYKEQKNAKRQAGSYAYFMHLFVSLLFFIAFAVLEIIYHTAPIESYTSIALLF